MSPAARKLVDARHAALRGTVNWIRPAAMPFQRTGSCKAADWKSLLEFGMEYCFADCVPAKCSEAFWALIAVFRRMLTATCDVGPDGLSSSDASIRTLQRDTALALSLFDRDVPKTESAIIIHIIKHIPETIWRWSAVSNTWAFHGERYT